jgi:hypothetical protein
MGDEQKSRTTPVELCNTNRRGSKGHSAWSNPWPMSLTTKEPDNEDGKGGDTLRQWPLAKRVMSGLIGLVERTTLLVVMKNWNEKIKPRQGAIR